jgi:hypothetical protein
VRIISFFLETEVITLQLKKRRGTIEHFKEKESTKFCRSLQVIKLLVDVCQEGEEGNFKPCLIEDEGGPLEAAMQVEASNHRSET